jgi:glycine/D-amino acid oxidase-like deaminating enzyme
MTAQYQDGAHTSLWLATTTRPSYAELQDRLTVDVAIIGGGIVGLTAASLLCQAGKRVLLLEARRLLTGVTGHTTAKLTTSHGLIYASLREQFGDDGARTYAVANQAAMQHVLDYLERHDIDADMQRFPSYTYALDDEQRPQIEEEARAAAACGLPASFSEEVPLPFPTAGAVVFQDQAVYHPLKYLQAVAEQASVLGGQIVEHTRVLQVIDEGSHCLLATDHGLVQAADVIVATNYPIYDPDFLYTQLATHMSYALAVRVDGDIPPGLFYSVEEGFHSLRPYRWGQQDALMLVGGEPHKTGHADDTVQRYQRLEAWTRQYFPVREVAYHWATHDSDTPDGVPYIGRMTSPSGRVYVATGLKGWGMTQGTLAGMLLTDLITGKENPWASFYSPARVEKQRAQFREETEKMAPGEGKIIELGHTKLAVYRDDDGRVHAVSAVCKHRGCPVHWNAAERTWDCHCHGSRYDVDGHIIHAPASADLEPYRAR